MAPLKLLVAAFYASTALASPWSRNQKRGDGWAGHKTKIWGYGKTTTEASPAGYESTSIAGGWGTTCIASTLKETLKQSTVTIPSETTVYISQQASTVTLPASTIYHQSTVTLPGSVHTSISTIIQSAFCIGPVTECATTKTEISYLTRTAQGYNKTATSVITAPGTTTTEYR